MPQTLAGVRGVALRGSLCSRVGKRGAGGSVGQAGRGPGIQGREPKLIALVRAGTGIWSWTRSNAFLGIPGSPEHGDQMLFRNSTELDRKHGPHPQPDPTTQGLRAEDPVERRDDRKLPGQGPSSKLDTGDSESSLDVCLFLMIHTLHATKSSDI